MFGGTRDKKMYTIEEDKKEKMRRCIFVALGLGLLTVFLFFLFVSASVLYSPSSVRFPSVPNSQLCLFLLTLGSGLGHAT